MLVLFEYEGVGLNFVIRKEMWVLRLHQLRTNASLSRLMDTYINNLWLLRADSLSLTLEPLWNRNHSLCRKGTCTMK